MPEMKSPLRMGSHRARTHMELIDTHCHLDVADFDAARDDVLAACRANGGTRIVIPGVDAAGGGNILALCADEPGLYPTLGLHPVYLDRHRDEDVEELADWVAHHRPVAVGEIGLDFYIDDPDRARQQALFEAQLRIAAEADLPVLLHGRKAHDEVISTLRRIRVKGGICHAYNGSLQQAHHYIDLGFKLSFGGMLTYERSSKLRGLARELPLDAIVIETDAPDLTVASHRGERNSPAIYRSVSPHSRRCATKTPPNSPPRQTSPGQIEHGEGVARGGGAVTVILCVIFRAIAVMTVCNYNERFGGIQRLYGSEAAAIIKNLHVCVIGLGGVGSWAVEALARSGVGRLTLIDYDEVHEGNINRQLPALGNTIGRKKFAVLAERVAEINPECQRTVIVDFVTLRNLEECLSKTRGYDYVFDAIDRIKLMTAIIYYFMRY